MNNNYSSDSSEYHNVNNLNKFIIRDEKSYILPMYIFGYIVQFIPCVVGNGLELYILPQIKQSDDYIIIALCTLACSDLAQAFVNMPVYFIKAVYVDWFLGGFLCKFLSYIVFVNRISGIWITVYIAFDRYINICHHSRFLILKTKQFCIIVLISIFIAHLLMFSYYFPSTSIKYDAQLNCNKCMFRLSTFNFFIHGILVNVIYSYPLPVILLTYFYACILKSLLNLQYTFKTFLKSMNDDESAVMSQSNNIFSVKVLLFYVIFFILSNFPLFLCAILSVANSGKPKSPSYFILRDISFYTRTINSCMNPWICFLYSKRYRRVLVNLLLYLKGEKITFLERNELSRQSTRLYGSEIIN